MSPQSKTDFKGSLWKQIRLFFCQKLQEFYIDVVTVLQQKF